MSWEREEWRDAVDSLSDVERSLTRDAIRRALGICGDFTDALDDMAAEDEGEDDE